MKDDELKVPSQRPDQVNDETDDTYERTDRDDQRLRTDEFERANDMDTADEYPRRTDAATGTGTDTDTETVTGDYATGDLRGRRDEDLRDGRDEDLRDDRDDDLRLREPYAETAPPVTAEDKVVAGEPITGETTGTSTGTVVDETTDGSTVTERAPGELPTHDAPQETIFFDQDPSQMQARWRDLQTAFVDDPEEAVQQADALVGEVVDALTSSLSSRTEELRERWKDSGGTDTEQLRLALRDYRVVLERLLTLSSSTGTR